MSPASRLLLLWALLWGWGAALALASSCASVAPYSCCAASTSDWMLNGQGMNPCQLIEQVMRTCDPSFAVHVLPEDFRCPVTRDPSNPSTREPSGCCCSTVSFALFAACRLCQANDISITSYYDFLSGCGQKTALGDLPDEVLISGNVSVPPWARITPHAYGDLWNAQKAFDNATATAAESQSSSASGKGAVLNTLALTGALVGLALVGAIVGLLYYFRFRRRRVDSSAAPGLSKSQSNKRLIDLTEHIDQPSMADPGAPIVPWGNAHRLPAQPQPALPRPRAGLRVPAPLQRLSGLSSDSSAAAPTGHPLAPSAQFLLSIGQPPLFSITPGMVHRR
ncbi:hypothetical protein AURDEDRAFT_184358 [Auricularia subglabra TFB-10046 SS5]|nr:hypothetical protein AURDEDRAFT_184358 [Auricularia subglabra TFB-10046 SS5]